MARQGYLVNFAIAPETAHTGYGYLDIGDATHDLVENQSTYVPLGTKHRLENIGTAPLILMPLPPPLKTRVPVTRIIPFHANPPPKVRSPSTKSMPYPVPFWILKPCTFGGFEVSE